MLTWIKENMFGGFEGIAFPKEPVVWLGFIAAIANLAINVLQGDLTLWPDGVESFVMLVMALVGRGMVTPNAKVDS